jgi:hypothetical protein
MSYQSNYKIEEIDKASAKGQIGSKWRVCQEYQEHAEQIATKPSKLKQVAESVGGFWLAFLAFLIALLIALGFAFGISGISAAIQGVTTGSAAMTMAGTLMAITSSAAFLTLAATIRSMGKYLSESVSNSTFSHHNTRDWHQLDNDAIELKTVK